MSRSVKIAAALLSASALIAIAAPASADVVVMTAHHLVDPVTATTSQDFVDAFNLTPASTPGYVTQVIADWDGSQSNSLTGFGASGDLAYHDKVIFYADFDDTYFFRFGIDFGLGGTLRLDNTPVETNPSDMWWNHSFSIPSQYLKGSQFLTKGFHTFDLYGFEHCCDGGTDGQWAKGSPEGFQDFKTGSVPEPASWALMIGGFGLAGAALRRRRTAAATA